MKIEDKYWLKIIECLQSLIFPGIITNFNQYSDNRGLKWRREKYFRKEFLCFFFLSLQLYFNKR